MVTAVKAVPPVPRRTQTRAKKARDKIENMVREWRQWQGAEPTVVRVNTGDYLALVEMGWVRDGKLSGSSLEIKPG